MAIGTSLHTLYSDLPKHARSHIVAFRPLRVEIIMGGIRFGTVDDHCYNNSAPLAGFLIENSGECTDGKPR